MVTEPEPRLFFSDQGRGDVLVLVHAFPLDGRMWDAQRNELARRVRVLVPDLAGFGRSAHVPARRSLDEHADDLAAVLDQLAIERATIVGLSMGGYIALAFCRRHPSRLSGLGLADTRAAPDTPEGKAGRDQNIALVSRDGATPLVDRMLPKLLSPGASRDVVELVRSIGLAQPPATLEAALGAMRDRADSDPILGHIDVPVAVIVGDADAITPPPDARATADVLARAELMVLPRAGHLSNLEAPSAFNAVLERLMDRVARRPP